MVIHFPSCSTLCLDEFIKVSLFSFCIYEVFCLELQLFHNYAQWVNWDELFCDVIPKFSLTIHKVKFYRMHLNGSPSLLVIQVSTSCYLSQLGQVAHLLIFKLGVCVWILRLYLLTRLEELNLKNPITQLALGTSEQGDSNLNFFHIAFIFTSITNLGSPTL